MYQAIITNVLTGKEAGKHSVESLELLNEWIADCESKQSWGYSQRSILKSECPETHLGLVLSEEERVAQESYEKPIYKLGVDDQLLMEEYSYYDLDNNLQIGLRPIVDHYETVPAVYETWVNLDKEYTVTIEDITAQHEAEQELSELIQSGKNDESCCRDVIALLGGYNKKRSLPLASVQQMIQTFSTINELLKNNMPGTAKLAINAITPSELIPQDLIDKTNTIFAKYGV